MNSRKHVNWALCRDWNGIRTALFVNGISYSALLVLVLRKVIVECPHGSGVFFVRPY